MMEAQRDTQLYNLGLQMGYNQTEARAFADQLNHVVELTSLRTIYQNMRNGMPPPR